MAHEYTAVVLDDASKTDILQRHVFCVGSSREWRVHCHHMTCDLNPAAKSIAADFVGQRVALEVVAFGYIPELPGGGAEGCLLAALEVKCVVPSKNATKHITLYHHKSMKPRQSNDIVDWVPVEPYTVYGVVQEVNPERKPAEVATHG